MQQMRLPGVSDLIELLRALGFVVSEIEQPYHDVLKRKGGGLRIEMTSNSPSLRVVMDSTLTPPKMELNPLLESLSLHNLPHPNIPEAKKIVAREVVELLLQFIKEKVPATTVANNTFDNLLRRRSMSTESITTTIHERMKFINTNDFYKVSPLIIDNTQSKVALDERISDGNTETTNRQQKENVQPIWAESENHEEHLEIAMEVEEESVFSPASSVASSIFCSNLSPIGIPLARQRTWVKGSTEENIDTLTKVSTPRSGIKSFGTNKVQRPKQLRSDLKPNKLRFATANGAHLVSQTISPREVSLKYSKQVKPHQPQSQIEDVSTSSVASASSTSSSISSKSSIVSTKSEPRSCIESKREGISRRSIINESRSFSTSNRGTLLSGVGTTSTQSQNRTAPQTNSQRKLRSVVGNAEGTTSIAVRNRPWLLPNPEIQNRGDEQSKPRNHGTGKVPEKLEVPGRRFVSSVQSSYCKQSSPSEINASSQKQTNRTAQINSRRKPKSFAGKHEETNLAATRTRPSRFTTLAEEPPKSDNISRNLEMKLEATSQRSSGRTQSFSRSIQGPSTSGGNEGSPQERSGITNSTSVKNKPVPAAGNGEGAEPTAVKNRPSLLPRYNTRR